jgi:hypothetical protein
VTLMLRKNSADIALFWIAWLLSYYVFVWALVVGFFEQRYFTFALPALCALAIGLLLYQTPRRYWVGLKLIAFAAALASNAIAIEHLPRGVVGYDAVADQIARLDEPGNVLLSCWDENDLIFRIRCRDSLQSRSIMRADRCLVNRRAQYTGPVRWRYLPTGSGEARTEFSKTPEYGSFSANQSQRQRSTISRSEVLAMPPDCMLDVVRRGRIRYLLTCAPPSSVADDYPADMIVAHLAASWR